MCGGRTPSCRLKGSNELETVKCKLSCAMRKSAICICENKGEGQLGGSHVDDQRPCF